VDWGNPVAITFYVPLAQEESTVSKAEVAGAKPAGYSVYAGEGLSATATGLDPM
jgi:hypothetical protein